MNMNSNIKYGTSINGGMVLTDMPIEALKAMRDSIDDAIRNYQEQEKDKYATDIQAAIDAARDAARDAGYEVYINEEICEDDADICLDPVDEDEDEDEDDWDDDDWRDCDYDDDDDEDDDPCYGCREDCLHCSYWD